MCQNGCWDGFGNHFVAFSLIRKIAQGNYSAFWRRPAEREKCCFSDFVAGKDSTLPALPGASQKHGNFPSQVLVAGSTLHNGLRDHLNNHLVSRVLSRSQMYK